MACDVCSFWKSSTSAACTLQIFNIRNIQCFSCHKQGKMFNFAKANAVRAPCCSGAQRQAFFWWSHMLPILLISVNLLIWLYYLSCDCISSTSISTAISQNFCSQGREPMANRIIIEEKNRMTINLHESFIEHGQLPKVSKWVDPVNQWNHTHVYSMVNPVNLSYIST